MTITLWKFTRPFQNLLTLEKSVVLILVLCKKPDVWVTWPVTVKSRKVTTEKYKMGLRRLSPFRKRSLPFWTVDATIGNQAFCHDRCNILSGLKYNKANDPFFNSHRKSNVEAQVKFTSKAMEMARVTSPVIHLREKDWNTKGSGSTLVAIVFLFKRTTLDNRSKILKCLKNGSNRSRQGSKRWRDARQKIQFLYYCSSYEPNWKGCLFFHFVNN